MAFRQLPRAWLSKKKPLSAGIWPDTVRLWIGAKHKDDLLDNLKRGFLSI